MTNIETHIKEPLTSMDYWGRISSREPLTHEFHDSEVSLIINFKN
jgi:hypothetical protein